MEVDGLGNQPLFIGGSGSLGLGTDPPPLTESLGHTMSFGGGGGGGGGGSGGGFFSSLIAAYYITTLDFLAGQKRWIARVD